MTPLPVQVINGPGGQQDQGHGTILHDQGEGLQPCVTPTSESSQIPQGLSMTPPTCQGGPGGQQDQGHGEVLHDQEEGYQLPITSRIGSSQVPQGLSMSPPTCQGGPGGLWDQEHGVVLHDLWEKVINHPQLLGVGVAKYLKEASCSKLRCKPQYPLVIRRSPKSLS